MFEKRFYNGKSWQGSHLLTGAPREALVDNKCFSSNPDRRAIGTWARYLGSLTSSNTGVQAIGSWAKYLGLGTLAQVS